MKDNKNLIYDYDRDVKTKNKDTQTCAKNHNQKIIKRDNQKEIYGLGQE
jgi:hypothetical protein